MTKNIIKKAKDDKKAKNLIKCGSLYIYSTEKNWTAQDTIVITNNIILLKLSYTNSIFTSIKPKFIHGLILIITKTSDKKVFQNIHKAETTVKKLLNKLILAAPIFPSLEPKKKRIKAFIIGKYKTNKYIFFTLLYNSLHL